MSNIDRVLIFIFLSGIPWTLHAGNNYFLCNTSKGTLSLTSFGETLIYEMNSQHGNKFQFISDGPMYSGFFYNHYSRFQTDYFSVSFIQSGYKYSVFSNYDNGSNMRGVSVIDMKTKKEYVYNCKDYKVDRLYNLKKKLKCDINNVLSCQ